MTAEEIIRQKGLKSTIQRTTVVGLLLSTKHPLSEKEIKDSANIEFDRVTFYRTMKTLQEAGVIHSIVPDGHNVVYALNFHHEDEHAHFVCDSCHKTVCLEGEQSISPSLPQGYTPQHSSIIIHGLCDECSSKH